MIRPPVARRLGDERGFTLVELLIVAVISAAVLGSAAVMATNVQTAYSYEADDAAVQQEARYALEWIARTLLAAGSNPYGIGVSDCPAPGTAFAALRLDPDGDGIHDDVRVQADISPPNGLLVGGPGLCNEAGEDITIGHDPVNLTVTRRDMATDAAPVAVTDGVFPQLRFTYLTANRAVTTVPAAIAYVQVRLTGRSDGRNAYTGQFTTFAYQSEVRLRSR